LKEKPVLDIVVSGGLAVLPSGAEPADIGISGEKIAAIGLPGSLMALGAGRVVDAAGQVVIPGGIDPHVHCRWPMPTPGQTQANLTDGPDRVSQAALFGGTTTILDFALVDGDNTVQQAIERRQKEWAGDCHCDYAFHTMVQGKLDPSVPDQLAEAVAAGYPTVKMFTTDITPSRKGRMVQFGDIWEVLKVLAKTGGLAAIHAEDNDIVMHMYEKLTREGRTGFENMAEVHNTLSEDLAFNRVIRLAANIEGCALYMLHTSAATGVRAIAEARAKGVPIYGETLHQYLMYSAEDYKKPNGQIYHTYPSLKFAEDHAALWAGTNHGAIQTVATDEICCPLKFKLQGSRIDDTTGGNAGVEPRVSLIYTETVEKRGYDLTQFVGLVSTNAAKIMGLYPRKGALAVGSDADIVVLDTRKRHIVRAAEMHEADYSPWEGRDLAAWPSTTMLRGKIVVDNGAFRGDLKDGQFMSRKLPDDIRTRPAV
jgi:dihydropyrimidinase